jgi:hypothetical protein
MSIAEKFRWDAIDDEQFEELVFKVLKSANPQQIEWRKGPGDKGRDIQVQFRRQGALGDDIDETYFVEVKHYQAGVSPSAFEGSLAWASAEQPQVLLIVVSSHLTIPCREYLETWRRKHPKIRVPLLGNERKSKIKFCKALMLENSQYLWDYCLHLFKTYFRLILTRFG